MVLPTCFVALLIEAYDPSSRRNDVNQARYGVDTVEAMGSNMRAKILRAHFAWHLHCGEARRSLGMTQFSRLVHLATISPQGETGVYISRTSAVPTGNCASNHRLRQNHDHGFFLRVCSSICLPRSTIVSISVYETRLDVLSSAWSGY